jgi:hypothetical protein
MFRRNPDDHSRTVYGRNNLKPRIKKVSLAYAQPFFAAQVQRVVNRADNRQVALECEVLIGIYTSDSLEISEICINIVFRCVFNK